MTGPSSNVYSTDEDESKRIIVHKTLLQNCSANKDKLKKIIVNKNLSQNYPADLKNYVQRRKTNQNTLLQNKKTQGMR